MAHLFPLIVFAIIIIAKILEKAGKAQGPGPKGPPAPRPSPPAESEQERLRRFMEAVGLPPGSAPPPHVRPRTSSKPPPLLPVNPPLPGPIGVPRRLRRALPVPPTPRTVAPVPAPPAPPPPVLPIPIRPAFQEAAAAAPSPPRPSFDAHRLLLRLRDPAAIREAIILREVLGPPKALQI